MRRFSAIIIKLFILALSFASISACQNLDLTYVENADDSGSTLYQKVDFSYLTEWSLDNHSDALITFLNSCNHFNKLPDDYEMGIAGSVKDWRQVCDVAESIKDKPRSVIRSFFEEFFVPYYVASSNQDDNLFTGYYEILLRGSYEKSDVYNVPIYHRPKNLMALDIGDFITEAD